MGGGGVCQSAACDDAVRNGSESDVDCGGPGSCPRCATGDACAAASDCESLVCAAGACLPPECFDGVENGGESDTDCGGPCDPCGVGLGCGAAADCTSGVCGAGLCAAPSCSDGVKNGGEVLVDCGGGCPCPDGTPCAVAEDCTSGVCAGPPGAETCAAPTCFDSTKNGTETDYDCGGACTPCLAFHFCLVDADCKGGSCNPVSKTCDPTCTDGQLDGLESDLDCGGPCPQCRPDKDCFGPEDCTTGICEAEPGHGTHCQPAATCANAIQDAGETDLDCGGPLCEGCTVGMTCLVQADCFDSTCAAGTCQ